MTSTQAPRAAATAEDRRSSRLLDWWFDGAGRFAGILVLVSAALILLCILVLVELDDQLCFGQEPSTGEPVYDGDCGRVLVTVGSTVAFVLVAIFLFSLATFVAFLGRWRRRRIYQTQWLPRVQAAKQWYAEGRVTRDAYESVLARFERMAAGAFLGERLLMGASLVQALGLVILLAIVVPFMLLLYALFDPQFDYMQGRIWALFAGSVVVVATGLALYVGGFGMRRRAIVLIRRTFREAETAEDAVLRRAHDQATGSR